MGRRLAPVVRWRASCLLATFLLVASGCAGSGTGALPGDVAVTGEDVADATAGAGPASAGDVGVPGLPPECHTNADCADKYPDIGPCRLALCDVGTQSCRLVARDDYTTCDDGNACTTDTICVSGECIGGQAVLCYDDNPCTDDGCDPSEGCFYLPNSKPCDDGNPCTDGDHCAGGECASGPSQCPCLKNSDCKSFDDGNPCNGTLRCGDNNTCEVDPDSIIRCGDLSIGCQLGTCDPAAGGCVYVAAPDGLPCTDGSFCTLGDRCVGGECKGSDKVNCGDKGPCTQALCIPSTGCVYQEIVGPCDDGNPCTEDDHCVDGECRGTGNTCECQSTADCEAIDDDNLCNGRLVCIEGVCQTKPGSIVTCDTSGDTFCRASSCDPATGECVKVPQNEGVPCDDGDECTGGDVCTQGACVGQPLPACVGCTAASDCDDGDPCTLDACSDQGECVHQPSPTCGAECSTDADCNDSNPCTDDACTPGGTCENTANTEPCDDGDACTSGDHCDGGTCASGAPLDCDDANPCTLDTCTDPFGCAHLVLYENCCTTNEQCDDGYACTTDVCANGFCSHPPKNCLPSGGKCDLAYCAQDTGECTVVPATQATGGVVVYQEDFDDGVADGWFFSTKNPAVYWSVQTHRAHSGTAALYGGNPEVFNYATTASQLVAWLPLNKLNLGTVTLEFYAWMDVDPPGVTTCADRLFVSVAGVAYQPLLCEDTAGGWTKYTFDLTDLASNPVTVAFIFEFDGDGNESEGVYIDDVVLRAAPPNPCP